MEQYKKYMGFRIVDFLVFIMVVGILSSIVFMSIGSSQAFAQDNSSTADLVQIDAIPVQDEEEGLCCCCY